MGLIEYVAAFAVRAKQNGMRYGHSTALPPCDDNITSCDRGIFRPLWEMSSKYRDQQQGGETVITMERYLFRKGWRIIGRAADLRAGDIVLMSADGTSHATASWHTFILTAYDPNTQRCNKYDFGSQSRIDVGAYFENVPLDEWSNKSFYCGFRCPDSSDGYSFDPETVALGSNGNHVLLCQEILRARGFKGQDGRELDLDRNCGYNTECAIRKYQTDRNAQGVALEVDGICGAHTWSDLLGM